MNILSFVVTEYKNIYSHTTGSLANHELARSFKNEPSSKTAKQKTINAENKADENIPSTQKLN